MDYDGSPAPIELRVDGRAAASSRRAPLALARDAHPRLSWVVPLVRGRQGQRAFRIRLVNDRFPLRTIDSGEFTSADPWWVMTQELPPFSRWQWRVMVQDETGTWSPWSEPAMLEVGPLHFEEWDAAWVSHPAGTSVRIRFHAGGSVRTARLHLTAQGIVRAQLDGQPVNPGALDPSRTDADLALYRTYDITELCTEGRHDLTLTLGLGHWGSTGIDPRALALVVLEGEDGSITRFATSGQEEHAASRVVVDEPFYLERHDLGRPLEWTPSTRSCAIEPGLGPANPPRDVRPDAGPPVHEVTVMRPVPLAGRTDGVRVFDVGVNIAGRVRLRLLDPVDPQTTARLVHGEHLDAAGRVDTTNLTLPRDAGRTRQVVEYVIGAGDAGVYLEPWFSYAGFRYVEVTGLPVGTRIELSAHTLHSDLRATGELHTGSAVIDRLVAAGRRTLLNNVHGIPEDCPTREQAGWTGDTASASDFDFAAFDMEAFFAKWLHDLATSQAPDGSIPAVAPHLGEPVPADPVWGAALQRILLGHWLHYGDRRVLAAGLVVLRRWTGFLLGCVGPRGIVDGAPISYGHDWLGLQQTPPELLHTGATIDAFEVMARLEREAGNPDRGHAASAQARVLRDAARRVFVEPSTGAVANGSQGSMAIAIAMGIVDAHDRQRCGAALVEAVRARGNRASTGFASTRALVTALSSLGADQTVFDILSQPAQPGVGAMIAGGVGTFWECWWVDAANTGTGSLDHLGLGAPFAAWAWNAVAGVYPLAAGFRRFRVDPRPVSGVQHLSLTLRTVRGGVRVSWRADADSLTIDLTVPVGATAVVAGADGDVEFGSGTHRVTVPRESVIAPRPVVNDPPFRLPVRAPRSADVDRAPELIELAAERGALRGADGASVELLPAGLVCMPVPHEQEAGPVARVAAASAASGVMLELHGVLELHGALEQYGAPEQHHALDLTEAQFVYARLDADATLTARTLTPVIVVHSADGSHVRGTARLWPAGWNRVAVDVGGWPGRSSVVRIDVGVEAEGDDDGHPLSIDIAAVGWSASARRW